MTGTVIPAEAGIKVRDDKKEDFILTKYLTLTNLSWQSGLVYRTSLIMWRLRQFLGTLMSLTIWQVLYQNQNNIFDYQRNEMIGYILLVSILQSIILSTVMHGLASDVYSGRISKILIKPINLYAYFISLDLADKLKNIFFSFFEGMILFLIFQPQLMLPSWPNLIFFLIAIILGVAIFFLVQFLFGSMGFWTPDTWAPRFLFFMFLNFTAGKMFPLDILPDIIQKIIFFTPFPYLSYVQIQIFLGRFTTTQTINYLLMAGAWLILLIIVNKKIWKKGIKEYTATGI